MAMNISSIEKRLKTKVTKFFEEVSCNFNFELDQEINIISVKTHTHY